MRFPSGLTAHLHLVWLDPHKERRFTVVGSRRMATFDDMELERKLTVYDKGFDEDARTYGEYITRSGDIFSPRIANVEPLRVECEHFIAVRRERARRPARTAPAACAWCACSRPCSPRWTARAAVMPVAEPPAIGATGRASRRARSWPTTWRSLPARSSTPASSIGAGCAIGSGAVIHAGTAVGERCVIEDGAVLGKRPRLRPGSSAAGRRSAT